MALGGRAKLFFKKHLEFTQQPLTRTFFETLENYSQEHVRRHLNLALWEKNHVNHGRIYMSKN